MNPHLWTAVDAYFCERLVPPDLALGAALTDPAAAGLPAISVTPNQGKLLSLLVQLCSARTVLQIGGGYSTIWLAGAMAPGGRVVTLEADPRHADVARANIARAGLSDVVDVRLGAALDTLPTLAVEGAGPFDRHDQGGGCSPVGLRMMTSPVIGCVTSGVVTGATGGRRDEPVDEILQ